MNELMSTLEFPDKALFQKVTLVPVYLEPLAYSGERIFVGLILQSDDEVKSFPLTSLSRLQSVYGVAFKSLVVAQEIALNSLLNWIAHRGIKNINEWVAPGDGIFIGRVMSTTATSVAEAVRTSFAEFSSLYEEPSVFSEKESTLRAERLVSLTASRLEATIKDLVSVQNPALSLKFGKKFQVNEQARPMKLGFVGHKLVANFGLIVPESLTMRVSSAKARLWDLASARAGVQDGWFNHIESMSFSLLLHHATERDIQYSKRQLKYVKEALVELETEADKLKLRCHSIVGPQLIAEHLIRAEA